MLTAEYDYETDMEVQEEAFESGEEFGKYRLNQLYAKLVKLNRNEDMLKAIQDEEYQKNYLKN